MVSFPTSQLIRWLLSPIMKYIITVKGGQLICFFSQVRTVPVDFTTHHSTQLRLRESDSCLGYPPNGSGSPAGALVVGQDPRQTLDIRYEGESKV